MDKENIIKKIFQNFKSNKTKQKKLAEKSNTSKALLSNGEKVFTSGLKELDEYVNIWKENQSTFIGYPINEKSELHDFYEWYINSGVDKINLNNVGNPMADNIWNMSSRKFEREVIEFFAPLYGYDLDNVWGIVTYSGTDGNNHGIYFGVKTLYNKTGMLPIVYVSEEAHYSNRRLCDLQNLDFKIIKSDEMGRMIPEELEKALDTTRPCLVVYAMGSTFKGAIDDMEKLNAVLDKHPDIPAVYRHVDAALFGGYLPFTKYNDIVNHKKMKFDSIAVSGHKFFGFDSPSGLFICTREVYDRQNDFNVPYLNNNMCMINCSRDSVQALKFWWLIKKVGFEKWREQAEELLKNTTYFDQKLTDIGWPHWINPYSNTIFFKSPSQEIIEKYMLPCDYDEHYGGKISHLVVMQHVTKETIDSFIEELRNYAEKIE